VAAIPPKSQTRRAEGGSLEPFIIAGRNFGPITAGATLQGVGVKWSQKIGSAKITAGAEKKFSGETTAGVRVRIEW
jgi:hypothetical protein